MVSNGSTSWLGGERGFTMVELLISFLFVSILSAIALSAFYVYKEDSEYSKAEADLRNARTAFAAFEVEDESVPAGFSIGLTYSGTDGSPLPGALGGILPGAVVSKNIRLGATYNTCNGAPPETEEVLLLSQPCKAYRYTSWLKRCDGVEVFLHDVAQPDVC